HAESELNVPGARRDVPDADMSYPLTRRGVEQTRALVAKMQGLPVTKVYTSTHLRAVQTASAIAHDHILTLQLAAQATELDLGIPPGSDLDVRQVYADLARRWLVEVDVHA